MKLLIRFLSSPFWWLVALVVLFALMFVAGQGLAS